MRPIEIPALTPEQLAALEEFYRTTRDARLRTRAQMILLAAERRMTAAEIAEIVRASEETVRRSGSSATSPKGSRGFARYAAPRLTAQGDGRVPRAVGSCRPPSA